MSHQYSAREYTFMLRAYFKCNENAAAALEMYRQQYPDSRQPTQTTIKRAYQRLLDHGSFYTPSHAWGRGRSAVSKKVSEQVLAYFEDDPRRSTNDSARQFSISQYRSWRVVKYRKGSSNPSGSEVSDSDSDSDSEGDEAAPAATRKHKSSGSARRRSGAAKPGKKGSKPGKKGRTAVAKGRGRRARSESEDESEKSESESENESGSGEGEESDEPSKKRGRQAVVVKKGKAVVAKTNAKATPVKRKAPAPPEKKKPVGRSAGRSPAKKSKKASSDEDSGESSEEEEEGSKEKEEVSKEEEEGRKEEEESSEEEESREESDSPGDKKAKRPPSDDDIMKCVKQILVGANLEQITMKTMCEQVYSHYPDFNLAHKKDFIKATVKLCI